MQTSRAALALGVTFFEVFAHELTLDTPLLPRRHHRKKALPQTPDRTRKVSKRRWDGQVILSPLRRLDRVPCPFLQQESLTLPRVMPSFLHAMRSSLDADRCRFAVGARTFTLGTRP
jgi:hypothetical protein